MKLIIALTFIFVISTASSQTILDAVKDNNLKNVKEFKKEFRRIVPDYWRNCYVARD